MAIFNKNKNEEQKTEKEVAQDWDKNADEWAQQVQQGFDVYREYFNKPAFFHFVGDVKNQKALDAACGEGYNTRVLARNGALATGVDISEKMIKNAIEKEKREPLGIEYKNVSLSDLSCFPNDTFDVVISFMALMDCPNYQSAVKEIYRVLKKGGRFFFNITHPCFFTKGYDWKEDESGKAVEIIEGHYFEKTPFTIYWEFSHATQSLDVDSSFISSIFTRTISEYINGLIDQGFVIKKLEEPRPSEEVCQKFRRFRRWRDHAAMFLYVCVQK